MVSSTSISISSSPYLQPLHPRGSIEIPDMAEGKRLQQRLIGELPRLKLQIAVQCIPEQMQIYDARIAASLAVYKGIFMGLDGITSPYVRRSKRPEPAGHLTPALQALAQTLHATKSSFERVNKLSIPTKVSEATAIKLINQSDDLTDDEKDTARWFLATSPKTRSGDVIFRYSNIDTTGLEQLERNEWDTRAKVLTKLL